MSDAERPSQPPLVSAEGVISVPAFDLPLSAALSPQAATLQAMALTRSGGVGLTDLDLLESEADYKIAVDAFRAQLDQMFAKPLSERLLEAFPVEIKADRLGGVQVEEFKPRGEWDQGCVLINLHGGAFYSGATHIARVESIPVAHLGGFRVISVDYRQGYEHRYPAATQDVVAVFTELLKSYPAERIGIYGGSAGGALTLQTAAWLAHHGAQRPGAIAVLAAGGAAAGDGDYFSAIGTAQTPPINAFSFRGTKFGYFGGVDRADPLINPLLADDALRGKFPPCLLLTGTRAFDLSPVLATHRSLCRAGVESELHVFDGMGHCFYYDATLPEARDAYASLVRFLRKHLKG